MKTILYYDESDIRRYWTAEEIDGLTIEPGYAPAHDDGSPRAMPVPSETAAEAVEDQLDDETLMAGIREALAAQYADREDGRHARHESRLYAHEPETRLIGVGPWECSPASY